MAHRLLTLLLGSTLLVCVACSKGAGGNTNPPGGDGGTTTQSDGGHGGDAGPADAGCTVNGCSVTDYCSTASGLCLTGKSCMPNPSAGDPTGDGQCAYQADPNNPDYCGSSGCYCDATSGSCQPITPSCAPCKADQQCGTDPAISTRTGACVSYQAPDAGAATKVCLPTHKGGQACPPGYVFGTGQYMGDCVPSGGACGSGGACTSNADCDPMGANPVCNTQIGTCVPACSFNYTDGTSTCPPGQVCNVDPTFLTPSTNPNFGLGECSTPCTMTGFQCPSGTVCVADGPSGTSRCRPAPPACIRDQDCPPSMTYHTRGDCDLTSLACVNGCSADSQCMLGYSCQNGGCAQESCVALGGTIAACDVGQFCCGEQGGPSCPSGVKMGDCYDAPNPPWCGACTDGPVSAPDDVQRPAPGAWCGGGIEWVSCDPSVKAQCPAGEGCQVGPTFCKTDADCGGVSMSCQMASIQVSATRTLMTQVCTCSASSSTCPANSKCTMDSMGHYFCQSHWCYMNHCFQSSSDGGM